MKTGTPVVAAATLLIVLTTAFAQSAPGKSPTAEPKSFAGTWTGTCADGKEFVVVKLAMQDGSLSGTIALANTRGTEGQCSSVVNPPSEAHAMKVTDVQMKSAALQFKGNGRLDFEMSLVDSNKARLKFMGTPVEDNPWELKKQK